MRKVDQLNSYYAGLIEDSSNDEYLEHFGILGMKWGVRRYQNYDGTLTNAGRKRYEKENRLKTKHEYASANATSEFSKNRHSAKAEMYKNSIEKFDKSSKARNRAYTKATKNIDLSGTSLLYDYDGYTVTSDAMRAILQYDSLFGGYDIISSTKSGAEKYEIAFSEAYEKKRGKGSWDNDKAWKNFDDDRSGTNPEAWGINRGTGKKEDAPFTYEESKNLLRKSVKDAPDATKELEKNFSKYDSDLKRIDNDEATKNANLEKAKNDMLNTINGRIDDDWDYRKQIKNH